MRSGAVNGRVPTQGSAGTRARLYAVAQVRFLRVTETMPTRATPSGMTDRCPIDARIAKLEAERDPKGISSASRMVDK